MGKIETIDYILKLLMDIESTTIHPFNQPVELSHECDKHPVPSFLQVSWLSLHHKKDISITAFIINYLWKLMHSILSDPFKIQGRHSLTQTTEISEDCGTLFNPIKDKKSYFYACNQP
eukprot:GHVR01000289.1.p1 GENE.GHVR01000289.1~~GHVR01000289.1.p1  ORF type:complete len:118 (-),score=3.75 GHVR01000289.1:1236-1589(-)